MEDQLHRSLDSAHVLPGDISVDQRIAMWMDVVDTTETLLLGGLRREIEPAGDLRAAYRRWYAGYHAEHDEANQRVIDKLRKLGV
jgi:hypothetical protein